MGYQSVSIGVFPSDSKHWEGENLRCCVGCPSAYSWKLVGTRKILQREVIVHFKQLSKSIFCIMTKHLKSEAVFPKICSMDN